MTVYRVGLAHFVALAFFAGTLAACGVKSDLERPPAASYAAPAATTSESKTAAGTTSGKVFTEESRVQSVPAFSILPKMPPEEWEKQAKEAKEAKQKQTKQAPKKSSEPSGPDRPFILDGLL